MKNEQKILWKTAKHFLLGGFIFWIIETTIFLIYEGWHLKATHPIEIWCDKIVNNMWTVGITLTVLVCFNYLAKLTCKQ